jgi:hypothetical protein
MTPEELRASIVPKSDQVNADDLLLGPITVTVLAVKGGSKEQPVSIEITDKQPYKPCKSMRRVLVAAWGDQGKDWVGKSMTLYCDPNVMYGGVKVGGIRISHLSHIESDRVMMLTTTRGKKGEFLVKRLVTEDPVPAIIAAFESLTASHTEADFLAVRARCAGLSKAQLAKVKTAAEAAKVRMTPAPAPPTEDCPL